MLTDSPLQLTLVIYLSTCFSLLYFKPKFIFNDGKMKEFGTQDNTDTKTILPLWLIILLIGIFSYVFSLVIINFYKGKATN